MKKWIKNLGFELLLLTWLLVVSTSAFAASCGSYPFTLQNNTTADATQVMANFNTVRNCVINNAAGSGVNTDITSITGLSTPLSVPQGGSSVFIGTTSTGSGNAQAVATTTPIGFSLTNGYRVTFIAGFTNTAAATLNANSTGATAIRKNGPAGLEALTGGEIVVGNIVEAVYNGTFYVLLSGNAASGGGVTTRTNIATGGTVDLGTVPSHNARITSSAGTITSFGSTAVTTAPVYLISFAGANTLTYNATSMIIPGSGNITTAADDTAVVEYLGSGNWQVLSYTRRTGTGIVTTTPLCGATGFTANNNAGTPNTNWDMAATTVVMADTSAVTFTASSVSVTVNATTTGANGLDAGSLSTSRWYYGYLINNGTTTAGLLSLSATAPTMPSGYTYKCLLSATPTDGSSNFYRIKTVGNWGWYQVVAGTNTTKAFVVTSGTAGTFSTTTPTLTATNMTVRGDTFCAPTIASSVQIRAMNALAGSATASILIAPSTAYGGTNNGPLGSNGNTFPIYLNAGGGAATDQIDILLESSALAWASDAAGGAVHCAAWRLPVNAN